MESAPVQRHISLPGTLLVLEMLHLQHIVLEQATTRRLHHADHQVPVTICAPIQALTANGHVFRRVPRIVTATPVETNAQNVRWRPLGPHLASDAKKYSALRPDMLKVVSSPE